CGAGSIRYPDRRFFRQDSTAGHIYSDALTGRPDPLFHHFDPSLGRRERDEVTSTHHGRGATHVKRAHSGKVRRLLDPNARLGRESVLWRKCDSQLPSLLIPDKTLELTGIQCEPEGGRGEIEPGARSVFGFHRNLIARNRNVP